VTQIKLIVLHCAATPNGKHFTAEDIHRWHLERGWSGIGYHYVIDLDGKAVPGRPHYWQGAHVSGHNDSSLGICLIGTDEFTPEQERTLERLLKNLRTQYPAAKIRGHRDYDQGKDCPGFDVPQWLEARKIDPQ